MNLKRLLIGSALTLGLLMSVSTARAADTLSGEVVDLIVGGQPIPPRLLLKAVKERENVQEQQENTLKMLLNVPFEQRQYVFPAIFESDFIPQKIRTHPEIATWKGKMPTVIDPGMQDFANAYLADLNPRLYLFLAPRSLNVRQPDQALEGTIDWTSTLKKMKPLPPKEAKPFAGYGSIESHLPLSPEVQKNYRTATLTTQDIKRLGTGLQTLAHFMQTQPDAKKLQRDLSLLSIFYADRDNEQINPFQNQVELLRLLKKGQALDAAFQQAGFKNADEFAETADRIAKAYRVHFIDLHTAFLYHKIRGVPKETLNPSEQIAWVQSKRHEAAPGDVYFVEPHLTDIEQAFQKAGYQTFLAPLTIDEREKIGYTAVPTEKE